MKNYKKIKRENLVYSDFLKVYKDTLVNNKSKNKIEYFLTKKNDVVMVVPTTKNNDLIYLKQFVYALKRKISCVPAGHIEKGETPLEAGKRELLEETGYTAEKFEYVTKIFEYPTQDLHTVHIIHAKNAKKVQRQHLEESENLKIFKKPIKDVYYDIVNKKNNWISAGPIISVILVSYRLGLKVQTP